MKTLFTAVVVAVAVAVSAAQDQSPSPKPTPTNPPPVLAAPPEPPAPPPQLVNIRVDVTVTEDGGVEAVSRKTVSVTTADRRNGMVRSAAVTSGQTKAEGQISIDARPFIERDGRIRTLVTLNYVSHPHFSNWGQLKFEPLLDSGKPLVVSQAPSAVSDRRITIEVTATILK